MYKSYFKSVSQQQYLLLGINSRKLILQWTIGKLETYKRMYKEDLCVTYQ